MMPLRPHVGTDAHDLRDTWNEGGRIRVLYDPNNPGRHAVVQDGQCKTCSAVRGVFGSFLFLYGLYVML